MRDMEGSDSERRVGHLRDSSAFLRCSSILSRKNLAKEFSGSMEEKRVKVLEYVRGLELSGKEIETEVGRKVVVRSDFDFREYWMSIPICFWVWYHASFILSKRGFASRYCCSMRREHTSILF